MIAFSKIAGFEVIPRSEYSSTSRWSSPPVMSVRLIWSSQMLTPASVSRASLSLTCVLTLIGLSSGPGRRPVRHGPRRFHDVLDGYAEVLVHVLVGARLAEGLHPDEGPL